MKFIAALLLACTFGSGAAAAHDYALKSLKIDHPFARATPPGAKVAGVFAAFENTGSQSDRLLSVSTPMAGVADAYAASGANRCTVNVTSTTPTRKRELIARHCTASIW